MAVGAIYSRALAEGGLQHALATISPTTLNAQVIVQDRPLGPADYDELRATLEESVDDRLGHMLRDIQRFGRAQPNLPLVTVFEGRPPPLDSYKGRPFFLTDFQEHTRIVEGRWPQVAPVLHENGLDMEMVLGEEAASSLALEIGSSVYLIPFKTDPSERIALKVVGIAEPIDPTEEYWMGSPDYFAGQEYGGDRVLLPLYVPEETFFSGLGNKYPTLVGDYGWFLFLDTSVLTASAVKPTEEAIVGLETDINKSFPRSLVLSGLDNTLAEHRRDLKVARVPIYLYISLVVVVILYFLVLVMGLLARTRSDEASLLRSRGASMLQMSGLLAFAEGIVVLLSMVLGPFLALAIVRYGLLRTINPAGEGGALSVGLSGDMFVMGVIGGLLSIGVFMASGMGLARLGMVEFLRVRARPPTVPFLQRYYVDLLVLVVVGILLWQIQSREGFLESDVLSKTLEVDYSLLMGPVLILLAAAFLVLRLLPLLVRALAWVAALLAPAWVSFALARVARDPLPHGSLAIILMMAAALGVFGATFQSTLSQSQRDQALYDLGGDLVVRGSSFSASSQEKVVGTPDVRSISPIGRDSVAMLDGASTVSTTLLTLDPDTLPSTTWFRDDFSSKSLTDLLTPLRFGEALRRQASVGSALPPSARSVGVWVNLDNLSQDDSRRSVSLWVRVSDSERRYRNLRLGDLTAAVERSRALEDLRGEVFEPPDSTQGRGPDDSAAQESIPTIENVWAFFETPLPEPSNVLTLPFSVVSIFISASSSSRSQPGSIGLDDITVKGPSISSDGIVVEGYEEPGRWVPMPNHKLVADTAERTPQAAHSGSFGLTFSWQESVGGVSRGILTPPGPFPLPAIGGPTFQVGQQLRIKAGDRTLPLEVRGVADYFPTIDPSSRPFLLVALEDYREYVRRAYGGVIRPVGELWVSLDDSADRGRTISLIEEQLPSFASIRDGDALADLSQRNPLAGGGWNGLTILGISALTVAALLALGAYAAVSVHTGRIDLTVARALGMSRLQILLFLALERVLVAVLGVAAGAAIGGLLGWWVLGFLDVSSSGRPLLPPMVVTIQEWLVVVVLVDLAVALMVAIAFATFSARKLRPSDILRTAE